MKVLYIIILIILIIPFQAYAQHKKLNHGRSWYAAICFTPDAKQLVSASFGYDGTVRGWNVSSGKQLWEIDVLKSDDANKYVGDLNSMDVSPDGHFVAIGFSRAVIKSNRRSTKPEELIEIFDVTTRILQITLKGHSKLIGSLDYSPDGKRIASISSDSTARVWDVNTGKQLLSIPIVNRGKSVKFSPDGKMIAVTSHDPGSAKTQESGINLYDAETGKLIRSFPRPHYSGGEVDFSPEGRFLAIATNGNRPFALKLKDAGEGKAEISIGSQDTRQGQVDVWELDKTLDRPYAVYGGQEADSLVFSPSGLLAYNVKRENEALVVIKEIDQNKVIESYKIGSMASALAFSSDNTYLAVGGSKGKVYLFDLSKN